MNEIEAIKLKLSRAHNIQDVIACAKQWRDTLLFRTIPVTRKLRTYQLPLSNKIIEYVVSEGALGNEIVSLWARQSGKTETVSDTVLSLGIFYIIFLKEGFQCGLFAPVESMITHVTRNRVRERYKPIKKWMESVGVVQTAGAGVTSSIFILENKLNEKEFYIRSLSVGETADIIGPTFRLMIIEQSELVNSLKLKNDVFPMGSTKGGVRVMTGTTSPYFKNQYFKQAIERWSDEPDKNKSTSDYVEMVDWKMAASKSTAYARYVKRERDRMGEDSIEFKTQYGLEWAEVALKFIGWEDLANLEVDYVWSKDRLRFFGLDVARAGDSTVLTIIEIDGMEIHIIAWLELKGLDFEKQMSKIVNFMRQYAPLRHGLADIVGLGRALFDMLKKRLWDEVRDEKTGRLIKKVAWARIGSYYGKVKENDKMGKAMDREFQHDRIHFPKHTRYRREKNRFVEQILDLERKYTGHTLKLQAPNVKGRHDDYPISLALAIYAFKEKSFKGGVSGVRI